MTPGTLKLIGVGVLVVAILGLAIGLINYGQKLGKCQAENTRLEGEVKEATAWKDDALLKFDAQKLSLEALTTSELAARLDYNALLAEPPQIITRWRDVAVAAPTTIPLGNCDRAATNAWDVLMEAGLIGEKTWDDTFYSPPSVQDVLDAVQLEQSLRGPSLNLYLSSYPNHQWNASVGTYQLSTLPPSLVNR